MATFRIVLASLVTLVWLTGYGLAYARQGPFPTELTMLMGVVLGWALGGTLTDVIREARQKKKDDGDAE